MSQIISDNFTRANAGTLGANYTAAGALSTWSIVSNQANTLSSGTFNNEDVFTGASWTGGNDQYVEMTIQAKPADSDGGPMARGATTSGLGYMADINNPDTKALGTVMQLDLWAIDSADSFTPIGTPVASFLVSAGDVIRVEAQGSTIRMLVNGVVKISGTNSALLSGKPAMRFWAPTANETKVSLFAAGDFAAGGGSLSVFVGESRNGPSPIN